MASSNFVYMVTFYLQLVISIILVDVNELKEVNLLFLLVLQQTIQIS